MGAIGILAAVHQELAGLLAVMGSSASVRRVGGRDYHVGMVDGRPCVAVLARIGKVAAAASAVTLIREFGVTGIVFTGLAGGVGDQVRVGDVVVARSLLQHDMDARPLFARYEVPLLGQARFEPDAELSRRLAQCASDYLQQDLAGDVTAVVRASFGMAVPQVHCGLIASGDQFINDSQVVMALKAELPDVLCVEMEGAAVAQICHEYETRYAVIRTISDRADEAAGIDFAAFLGQVASKYSHGILRRFLKAWNTEQAQG